MDLPLYETSALVLLLNGCITGVEYKQHNIDCPFLYLPVSSRIFFRFVLFLQYHSTWQYLINIFPLTLGF